MMKRAKRAASKKAAPKKAAPKKAVPKKAVPKKAAPKKAAPKKAAPKKAAPKKAAPKKAVPKKAVPKKRPSATRPSKQVVPGSQGGHLLMSAVLAGDADALQKFLAAGANAAADPKALGVALARCDLACARLLDAAGAPLDLSYDVACGLVSTAVNAAADDATRAELVQLCHRRGARFPESVPEDEQASYPGHTVGQLLRIAAESGHEDTCLELLATGFPPEGGSNGETAIDYAASKGLTRLVGALIARGMPASPEALCHAASAGRHYVVEQLLRADPTLLNASTADGEATALMSAAEQGHLKIVMFLLAHGADKSLMKKDGKTALALARAGDHTEVVEVLED